MVKMSTHETTLLREKLRIAIDALKLYARKDDWMMPVDTKYGFEHFPDDDRNGGYLAAQAALKKIEAIDNKERI